MLKGLQAGEFIYEQPALGEAEYTFKHALTQEVAYNSVLMERRRLLHERTGEAIEALFKDRIDDHLAELAHHYSRTANTRKAVEYLFRAGSQAAARSAYSEAITRLSSALEFLKRLPDDAERARQELSVQSALRLKSCQCKRLGGGGIGACVCESARVVRANPRPCSRLPSPFWTMANALVEAGAAQRSGTRRRASGRSRGCERPGDAPGPATPRAALPFFTSASWSLRMSTWRRRWPFSTSGNPFPRVGVT